MNIRELPEGERRLCKLEDCSLPHNSKGFCKPHYSRWRRHGDPRKGRSMNGAGLNFLKNIINTKSKNCIIWPFGMISTGYGLVRDNGASLTAHRLSLILSKGQPPKDRSFACHKPVICHNRACVNPNHLYWGSGKDNNSDRLLDGTDDHGSKNPRAKLNEAQVLMIRKDMRTCLEIANDYGVARTTISSVKNGHNWKGV